MNLIFKFKIILFYINMKKAQKLDKKKEKKFKDISQILNVLNKYGNLSFEKYSPLEFSIKDIDLSFVLITDRLKFFKDYINNNIETQAFGIFVLFAFSSLFIGKNDLKFNNLNKKLKYFNILLKYIETKQMDKINGDLINFFEELEDDIGKKELKLFENIFQNK